MSEIETTEEIKPTRCRCGCGCNQNCWSATSEYCAGCRAGYCPEDPEECKECGALAELDKHDHCRSCEQEIRLANEQIAKEWAAEAAEAGVGVSMEVSDVL